MTQLLFLATETSNSGGGAIIILLLILFGLAFWLLPAIIAGARHHHNLIAIWVLTLLLGWTFIGWVIAIVWAFSNPAPPQQIVIHNK